MSVSNIFETLMVTGVAPGLDNQQTALAVQALLESQSIPEATAPVTIDEDDVFQCGKCKKQFNNISLFVSHKQTHCTGIVQSVQSVQGLGTLGLRTQTPAPAAPGPQQGAPAATIPTKQLPGYSAVPSSPLAQSLGHNIVLTDDLINFTTPVDGSVSTASLQVGSNPFLSQVSPGSTARSSAPSETTTLLVSTATTAASGVYPTTTTATQSYGGAQPVPSGATYTSTADNTSTHVIIQANNHADTPQQSAQMLASTPATILPTTANTNKALSLPGVLRATSNKTGNRKLTSVTLSNGQIAMISEEDLALTAVPPQIPPPVAQAPPTAVPPPQAPPPTQAPKSRRTKPVLEEPNSKKKLKCQYCEKTFAKNFDLQQHIRSHTGEKPFQCIVCGRAFAQKSNVKKHMQTHKVWPQGTGKTLPSQPPPKIISEHEDGAEKPELVDGYNIPPAKTIQMSVNKKKQSGVEDTSPPVKVNVVIDSSYMCQYCPTKCKSYFQLKSHMLQHKSEQVYKCVVKTCNQTFRELDNFLEHTKAHEEDMNYRCHMCNKLFPSLYELGVHQYSHSLYPNQGPKPGPRYFRCVKCNSKYATPAALQHHLDTVSHKHQCPHCHKIFTCERYLRRHLPIHGSTGPHVCEICDKQFKTEHYLKVHQLTHSTEKPFACEFCLAAFNRKDKLKRHMLVHETTKKYKCPFRAHLGCTKEFHRPDKLKAHIICHSGIKPYKCKECGKMFTRRPNLRQHERGHQKDWSFTCTKCGKGFLREKLFKMHKCRNMEKAGKAEKEVDGFIPTELSPKESNRRMFRTFKGQALRRGARQRRGIQRAAANQRKAATIQKKEPLVEDEAEPVQTEHMSVVLSGGSGAPTIQDVSIAYPAGDVEPGEISVVLEGTDGVPGASHAQYEVPSTGTTPRYVTATQEATAAQYATHEATTDNSTAAVITAEDGNVVVIQSLGQVPAEFTGLPQGSEVHYAEQIKPDGELVASGTNAPSGSPAAAAEIQYNLDYSPSIYQTAYSGGNATFQNATFITTGPNMATLVVEGPGGEVLTQENIATIVAQAPEQFSSHGDAQHQTYDVLEYPMATEHDDDPQEVAIMQGQDIVQAQAVAEASIKSEN